MCHVNITQGCHPPLIKLLEACVPITDIGMYGNLDHTEWNTLILSNTHARSSLRCAGIVWMGLWDPPQVCSLSQRRQLDYSFSSCFLPWHREDAPGALPSQTPPASKILKGEEKSKTQATPAPAARQRETGGEAEIGRQQERTEGAKVSHQCRDVSGDCPDFDKEQQAQQEGGTVKKSSGIDCCHSLSRAVKCTMQCLDCD